MRRLFVSITPLLIAAGLAAAFALGFQVRGCGEDRASAPTGDGVGVPIAAGAPATWTCSMHPQIKLPAPGKCPLCFMDLIPQDAGGGDGDESDRVLTMSESAMKLAEIATTPVVRMTPTAELRMVGTVAYDETLVRDVAVLSGGVIERLYVNYMGVPIRAGDHLAEFYSPEVYGAAQDLVLAAGTLTGEEFGGGGAGASIVDSARKRLVLLGVSDEQIDAMVASGVAPKTFTIYSPVAGVLREMGGHEGHWLDQGEHLGEIADLSTVWVLLDAYQSDLPLVRFGQPVSLTVEAVPGREFTGFVAFIPPDVSEATRTVKLRLNVPNPDGLLRPGMFVRASVDVRLTDDARVYTPELAGKWISPMHPEIVKDGPGQCDICGMDLVPAAELGYITEASEAQPPLVIPATAPLLTGRRAVVYVRVPGRDRPTFEGREVALGGRAGDFYLVREGLEEGEEVVTNGAFKIDSSLQIVAGRSMMSAPVDGADAPGSTWNTPTPERAGAEASRLPAPGAFLTDLTPLYDSYFRAQEALASDDLTAFQSHARTVRAAAANVDSAGLSEEGATAWAGIRDRLVAGGTALDGATDIAPARTLFEAMAMAMIELDRTFGHAGEAPHYVAHCPMAFGDVGADWLQLGDRVNNPYWGAMMLRCGDITRKLEPGGDSVDGGADDAHQGHGHD